MHHFCQFTVLHQLGKTRQSQQHNQPSRESVNQVTWPKCPWCFDWSWCFSSGRERDRGLSPMTAEDCVSRMSSGVTDGFLLNTGRKTHHTVPSVWQHTWSSMQAKQCSAAASATPPVYTEWAYSVCESGFYFLQIGNSSIHFFKTFFFYLTPHASSMLNVWWSRGTLSEPSRQKQNPFRSQKSQPQDSPSIGTVLPLQQKGKSKTK